MSLAFQFSGQFSLHFAVEVKGGNADVLMTSAQTFPTSEFLKQKVKREKEAKTDKLANKNPTFSPFSEKQTASKIKVIVQQIMPGISLIKCPYFAQKRKIIQGK